MSAFSTDRITLRQWQTSDLPAFVKMSADPEVMEYFPSTLDEDQSLEVAEKIMTKIDQNGFGFWALELNETKEFCGFVGLNIPTPELPFGPCLEVGWRLAKPYWGLGLATEGGRLAVGYGFNELGYDEIVTFTAEINLRSQAVMKRLGFKHNDETFLHPLLPDGHRLQFHKLYRMSKEQYLESLT
ncbi:GNAT family N-acetyltransferase [Sneathiella glossodoripedis]|uniref:GNAT family N-acetyltransferase n=1 Tax=Sneathiella glossodoripedis TaxID=418853 RepID=UPI000471431F|nr:GNAT family N-acetyltransferase [Sneathiella glossodoripedis]